MNHLPRFMAEHIWLLLGSLLLLLAMTLHAGDIEFPVLRSGTYVYSNVVVYGRSKSDLYIKHSQGMCNLKLATLDAATLAVLDGKSAANVTVLATATGAAALKADDAPKKVGFKFTLPAILIAKARGMNDPVGQVRAAGGKVLGIAAAVLAVFYLLICTCLGRICENAGTKPGVLIWIPIAQMLPMFKAAGMPAWWVVMALVPGLNLLALLVWSFNIVKACRKPAWLAWFLILPITNLFALPYLAFSGASAPAATGSSRKIGLRPVEVA